MPSDSNPTDKPEFKLDESTIVASLVVTTDGRTFIRGKPGTPWQELEEPDES